MTQSFQETLNEYGKSVSEIHGMLFETVMNKRTSELRIQALKDNLGANFLKSATGQQLLKLCSQWLTLDQEHLEKVSDLIHDVNEIIQPRLPPHLKSVYFIDKDSITRNAAEKAEKAFDAQAYIESLSLNDD